MKTSIIFPADLVVTRYNSAVVAALSSSLLVALMLIFSHDIIDFEENTFTSSAITVGVLVSIVAAGALSLSLRRDVLAQSGGPIICKAVEFSGAEYSRVQGAMAKGRWADVKHLATAESGVAMKVELVYTKDRGFAAYQFFRYVPHSYEPCSEVLYLDGEPLSTIDK